MATFLVISRQAFYKNVSSHVGIMRKISLLQGWYDIIMREKYVIITRKYVLMTRKALNIIENFAIMRNYFFSCRSHSKTQLKISSSSSIWLVS